MLLAIDIGNTNITFGLFDGAQLGPSWRIRTIHEKTPDEYGILLAQLFRHRGHQPEDVTGVVIASVVPPLTQAFEQASRDYVGIRPLVVDAGTRTGVDIRYDDPRQVGADGRRSGARALRGACLRGGLRDWNNL
jgi:type III pantothenate kinase